MKPAPDVCPCGGRRLGEPVGTAPRAYAQCCGPYIDGPAGQPPMPAPDAEALMRSRYSAFALGRADHLLATWHPSRRPADVVLEAGTRWLGLEVRDHRPLGAGRAEVAFVARSRGPGGRASRLHERSHFVREDGRWFYLDGAPNNIGH